MIVLKKKVLIIFFFFFFFLLPPSSFPLKKSLLNTPFPGLLHFTLDTYLILLSVKQGGIKYHF